MAVLQHQPPVHAGAHHAMRNSGSGDVAELAKHVIELDKPLRAPAD